MPNEATKQEGEESGRLDFGVRGFSGLKQTGGIIYEETHPKLRGTYGPKVYREMSDNSSAVGAILYLLKALVRQVAWRSEPASASDNEEIAIHWSDFLEQCIVDMSHTFEDFIAEVLSMLPYGFSYFETVYKIRKGPGRDSTTRSQFSDGRIGWRKFALRPQDTVDHWEFDDDGGLRGMVQADPMSGRTAFIPIEKSILFRTETTKGNPEGRSIFRNAVVDWFYLKRISEIEAIGIERDLAGLPVMEVPIRLLLPNATPDDAAMRADLAKMLGEIKRDEREFAMVPPEIDPKGNATGYKFKLLSSGGSRQFDTVKIKNGYKVGILQSVLAQFLELGMNSVGSFALASTSTNLFSVALGAYLQSIAATFNRFGVARLMEMNGVEPQYWPELVHGDIEKVPLDEVGAYISALAAAGQLPEDAAIKRRLLEIAGLPIPEIEEGSEPETIKPETGVVKKTRRARVVSPGPVRVMRPIQLPIGF